MSTSYKTVGWNRNKKLYDSILIVGIVVYVVLFFLVSNAMFSGEQALSPIILAMRALSTCAFFMLTFVLCIGPLARLDHRYLPLLYNRRHFGVLTFMVALLHGLLAIFWYHMFGVINPLVSVFTGGGEYPHPLQVPFQAFGAIALLILYLLAATSHDYWNENLGAPLWKALHMSVYVAYVLVVMHVALGALQQDNTGLLPGMVVLSVALVSGLHILSAWRASGANVKSSTSDSASEADEWVDVGRWQDIANNRGITVDIGHDAMTKIKCVQWRTLVSIRMARWVRVVS